MSDLGFYIRKCWFLAIVIAAFAGGFYVNGSVKSDLHNELYNAENELKSMQSDIRLSQQRMIDYHDALKDICSHSRYLFSENQPQELIDELRFDATGKNVVLGDIQFDIPEYIKARDNMKVMALMKFQVSMVGGYYPLWDFIKTLEKRPYLANIEAMNVTPNNSSGSELKMDLKGSFRVFDRTIVDWCDGNGA